MKRDFIVNVNNLTGGVTEQGFGLILAYDTTKEIPYSLITSAAELLKLKNSVVEEEIDTTETIGITKDDAIYKLVQKLFMQSPAPAEIAVAGKDKATVSGLNELLNKGYSDWFSLVTVSHSDNSIEKFSEWATANDKIYYATIQDKDKFKDLEYKNAMIGYHEDINDLVAEGLAAYMSVQPPGSTIAKFKTIQGSKPSEVLASDLKEIHKDNGFSYKRQMGVNHVTASKTTSGEYLDIVLGSYFLKFRIEEALFRLATNTRKIGYDDKGIGQMASEVRAVLNLAAEMGIILVEDEAPQYEMLIKRRKDMLSNKIASRDYDGITVKAKIAGAIEIGEINIDLVI